MERFFIVGCGDIGKKVARTALASGAGVAALIRSPDKAASLREMGVTALEANLDERDSLAGMPTRGAVVFYFAPPPGGGFTDPRVRAFCDAIAPGEEPRKIVYLSTSGVYGDCGGEVVTEETPPNPQTSRARRRYDAETVFRQWGAERGVPVVILRVTGIYGPGRLPLQQLTSGQPVLEDSLAPVTNRIHSDDLARICLAAAERGEDGDIFNVSDGHPTTMTAYFDACADALGLPRPRRVTLEEARRVMTPLMFSYVTESRKMDNRLMREKLRVTLLHPAMQEGVRSSVE
ncbi:MULTISPECIES: SDR family oxidoreductase [Geobacter]|uniref:NAD-dependent dehydratase n=2 Tax=Geobacter TaxID=28231 RepID=A0A0C1TL07_9BACT|nr:MULTISPECIES: SDR family oxidoreductase [Geobacter]KIE41504.1 NAD-dependent dehydratase [Geobacter soli]MBE2888100.1 SDR family oxidoreductase [Geobacter anodireducens]HMN02274.1 SDR family oxidoreductase [Geobacter anodireducens]